MAPVDGSGSVPACIYLVANFISVEFKNYFFLLRIASLANEMGNITFT
jgi:hypothetical protein